ncbi:tRNA pseudouridine(38-40) synthase TruA [Alkalibacter mobilis]|uniref:tRNA pseudouridine(38-40) synthase TruA n=1 Tax=Alkalibacter mobilis TaxID=2787712 RepID=UPI0018A11A61|nr:tRNA pseudouridine(38-40) synthase TruA [Alkalibacter mobilis]MBF7095958.1 tRNA pseudouridine(38-40) synthase TruA [Alkalibacter mobilis]
MRNIQLVIEYEGTAYCGWQIQPNGVAIQEVLIRAIEKITSEKIKLIGSGRTDAGVHAYGQSANFLTKSAIETEKFPMAINSKLPRDIRIVGAYEQSHEFHSRYSAKGKVYEYRILNDPYGSALDRNRVWHVKPHLDRTAIIKAMECLKGTHDFTTFSSIKSGSENKVRTICEYSLSTREDQIIMVVSGNGFLYNMVRIMTGTLVDVGLGKIDPDKISKLLKGKDRNLAGKTAPPQGLYLKKVIY